MQRLAVGIGVSGVHQPVFDAERLMQHLRGGRQPVGGTAAVADHFMPRRIVELVVNPHDDGDVVVLGRRRDNHPLSAAVRDVHFRLGFIGKEARRFDHHVHAHAAPGDLGGIALGKHLNWPAVQQQLVVAGFHFGRQRAGKRVVFQQVRQRFAVRQIVDRHHFKIAAPQRRAQHVAPDPAEAVNAYFHHDALLVWALPQI
ncbi:MAG: hypothetical protein E7C58_12630 [Serratia marcescens]|nr:hypothetical protein [Serratia marcescens]